MSATSPSVFNRAISPVQAVVIGGKLRDLNLLKVVAKFGEAAGGRRLCGKRRKIRVYFRRNIVDTKQVRFRRVQFARRLALFDAVLLDSGGFLE